MKFDIFPNTEKIDSSKTLNVKFGIDPTSDKLHLGHLIPLLILKRMWKEGHHIDIVLGTFTAQLGDPSGKDVMRPILTPEETEKNAQSIISQINRIFDSNINSVSVHKNGDWFNKMSAPEMMGILSKFTTTQLLSRDSFQKRLENSDAIGVHEIIVPLLQGFDSVKLDTDIEIGGNDQLFNFKMTRDLQKVFDKKPEICFLAPIINGTDGRKMSKSFGNCIFINDSPNDVFGKVMSISDETMNEWLPIFFDKPLDDRMGPMAKKKELAFEITKQIWSVEAAGNAISHFESVIQNKKNPDSFIEISQTNLINVILDVRKCSISDAKRLIAQGGIKINDQKISSENIDLKVDDIVKVGKLDFVKII